MDAEERRIIEALFDKLDEVGGRSGLADPEAEALIERRLAEQPGAAYRMAQTIVVQERALEAARARIAEAERRAAPSQGSGGFLSGLRGESLRGAEPARAAPGPWGAAGGHGSGYGQSRGSGFLAGAAQTAMGVAGGVVLGSLLADALTPDAAWAGEAGDGGFDGEDEADLGGDVGGDFGGE